MEQRIEDAKKVLQEEKDKKQETLEKEKQERAKLSS